jgi:hypothetical protein
MKLLQKIVELNISASFGALFNTTTEFLDTKKHGLEERNSKRNPKTLL